MGSIYIIRNTINDKVIINGFFLDEYEKEVNKNGTQ